MKLFELFNKGSSAKWKKEDLHGRGFKYRFFVNMNTGEVADTPSGIDAFLEYTAKFIIVDPEYSYTTSYAREISRGASMWSRNPEHRMGQFSLPDKTYEFHFANENVKDDSKKSEITGSGFALEVFGTVKEILKDAVSTSDAEYVLITAFAGEPSRVRLYQRFIGNNALKKWTHDNVVYWLIKV